MIFHKYIRFKKIEAFTGEVMATIFWVIFCITYNDNPPTRTTVIDKFKSSELKECVRINSQERNSHGGQSQATYSH